MPDYDIPYWTWGLRCFDARSLHPKASCWRLLKTQTRLAAVEGVPCFWRGLCVKLHGDCWSMDGKWRCRITLSCNTCLLRRPPHAIGLGDAQSRFFCRLWFGLRPSKTVPSPCAPAEPENVQRKPKFSAANKDRWLIRQGAGTTILGRYKTLVLFYTANYKELLAIGYIRVITERFPTHYSATIYTESDAHNCCLQDPH